MRAGCSGCLVGLVVGVFVTAVVLGGAWAVTLALETPAVDTPVTTAEDSARAQRKVLALYQRPAPERASTTPIVLSEREVNALVNRTLADEVPFSQTVVHLRADDRADIAGRVRVEDLLGEVPLSTVRGWLPSASRQRRVWLRTTVHAQVEPGRRVQVRLVPVTASIGRLPIPAFALRWLLEPAALRYLRWVLPERARGLRIEPGQVLITTAG